MDIESIDPVENGQDESDILADADQVMEADLTADNEGQAGRMARNLEEEPGDFVRVKST